MNQIKKINNVLITNMQTFNRSNKKCSLHYILIILLCLTPLSVNAELLLELYQQALHTNPTLLGRMYAIDRAMAQEDQAFSRLLPQISANGNYSYNRFNSDLAGTRRYNGLRGTVQARQALFDMSSFLRYQGTQAATRQTEQELEAN